MLISSLSAGIAGRLVERRKAWSARHRLQGTLCEHLTRRAVVARTRPTTLSSSTARPIDRCDVPTRRRLSSSRFGHPPILQLGVETPGASARSCSRAGDSLPTVPRSPWLRRVRGAMWSPSYVLSIVNSNENRLCSSHRVCWVCVDRVGRFGLFRFMSCCGAAARRLSLAHAPRRRSLAFVAKRPVRARASGPPTGTRRPCQPRQ